MKTATKCWLAILETHLGSSWHCEFPSQSSPTCVTLETCMRAWGQHREGGSCVREAKDRSPNQRLRAHLCNKPLCWKGSHGTGKSPPAKRSSPFVCWPLVLPGRQLFGNPSPPSHGLQDIQECVQIHTRVCEPAATGWTVFVNPLETSQYSPELHLLHALKLTVQATRMTLTDLVQYNVF